VVNDYFYSTNSRIKEFTTRINTYKSLFEKLPKLPQIQENLLRKSTLRSSLFSARIEGNTLDMRDVELNQSQDMQKKEVFQIFEALKMARGLKDNLTKDIVCNLHSIAMDGLISGIGRFRSEQNAIFNIAGVAIYMPPSPQKVKVLFDEFLEYMNVKENDVSRIAVAHFAFEKIHPFLDGNGRIGRLLMNWHLSRLGYGFAGLISFEEFLENNRERYYDNLTLVGKDITRFVEFILEAIVESSEKIILEMQDKKEESIEDTLLPRRSEILLIIHEHKMMSFDQIKRRFLSVGSRTLHYDLEHLMEKKLVKKLGNTNGAFYVPAV
jgi:Fic family protein